MTGVTAARHSEPLRVLLVEDNPADARLVRELLNDAAITNVALVHADRLRQAVAYLEHDGFNAILLDLSLPDSAGLATFTSARAAAPAAPIVILTGLLDEEMAVRAVREGAQDYLVKGQVDGRLLYQSIRYAIERGRVESELRTSEMQFRQLAEHIKEAFVVIELPSHRTIYVSPVWEEIWRRPIVELYEDPMVWFEAVHPDDRSQVRADREAVGRGLASKREFRVVRPDGTICWARARMFPVRDGDGQVRRLVGLVEDITERKEGEAATRASEARYRTLFDYAPDGILIADSGTHTVDANTALCRMLGYERDQLLGLPAAEIVAPADLGKIVNAIRDGAAGSDFHDEARMRRSDGSEFAADVIATGMPDGTVVGMIRDVTARNQATAALRAAEERMRFALESAGVGIWDMDYTTGVLRWSETLEAQYGFAPGTFDGTMDQYVERVHPDDRASLQDVIKHAMQSGADFTIEHRVRWPDGTVRFLSGAGRIHLVDGEPVRGVGISLDLTERHTLEQRYRQAQKMEAVGQLAGGVAHDFNNLLTAILGYAGMLVEQYDTNDRKRRDLSEIIKAGERAAALTRQLLAFSRQQVLQPTVVDLNALTEDLANMLRRLIGEHIELKLVLASDLGAVKADAGQLEQVIMNLVVNARDAMPKGGRLIIETANVELDASYRMHHGLATAEAGQFVMLAVSDTGIGMDAETRRRIFEPFFTTKPRDQGTGLGLATVYGILKQSSGYVWVYSELGSGTTFKIYLPRVDDAVERMSDHETPNESLQRGSETILLVEDEESVRVLSRTLLERDGYRVLEAASPAAALIAASEHEGPIHLLVADVMMPGESGPDLYRRLTASRPETRVLYISGYADQAIVARGILDVGAPFLQKPFSGRGLAAKVRETLDAGTNRHDASS